MAPDETITNLADRLHPTGSAHPASFTPEQLSSDPILKFFGYTHLPPHLQVASVKFYELASHIIATTPRNAERTVALRKLLEAKDAAVRAQLP